MFLHKQWTLWKLEMELSEVVETQTKHLNISNTLFQWAEYVLFASLLVGVCIIFAIMAYFYTYIDPAKEEAMFIQMEPDEKERRKSLEMNRKDSVSRNSEVRKRSDSSASEQSKL